MLISVHVKASTLRTNTDLQTMLTSGRPHYLKNLCACVVYVGTLTMLSQYAGPNVLNHTKGQTYCIIGTMPVHSYTPTLGTAGS